MELTGNGPCILPFMSSELRFSEMIRGWSLALERLSLAGWQECDNCTLYGNLVVFLPKDTQQTQYLSAADHAASWRGKFVFSVRLGCVSLISAMQLSSAFSWGYIGIHVVGCPMLLQVSLYYKDYVDDYSHTHLGGDSNFKHDHSRNEFTERNLKLWSHP